MSQMYDYFGNINPDLLNRIPQSASRILEVGCGNGALGAAYKMLNPMSTYVGVEYVPEAAEAARGSLDCVICGDVEDPELGIPQVDGKNMIALFMAMFLTSPRSLGRAKASWSAVGSWSVLVCITNAQHCCCCQFAGRPVAIVRSRTV